LNWTEFQQGLRDSAADPGKLRSFGLLVGGILAALGIVPVLLHPHGLHPWLFILGALLFGCGAVLPRSLAPVYRLWMWLGHILGEVNTRIIMAVLYYVVLTPFACVMRIVRHDPLRRAFDASADSYRVLRESRDVSHMRHQF
jgi:hypothetical protein